MAIGVAGLLGWGKNYQIRSLMDLPFTTISAINMSLAFCMGTDLDALVNSDQPMATIFFNSFGTKATLGLWAIVVLVQWVHIYLPS
jgi:hypothetical protein